MMNFCERFNENVKKVKQSVIRQSDILKESIIEKKYEVKQASKIQKIESKIQRVQMKLDHRLKLKPHKVQQLESKLQLLLLEKQKQEQFEMGFKDFQMAIENLSNQLLELEKLPIDQLSADQKMNNYKKVRRIRRQLLDIYRETSVQLQKHQTTRLFRVCDNLLEYYYLNNVDSLDEQEQKQEQQQLQSEIFFTIKRNSEYQQQQQQQQQQKQQFSEIAKEPEQLCQICFDQPKEYVAVPCGHFIYCEQCRLLVKNNLCLICRNEITLMMKVYQ